MGKRRNPYVKTANEEITYTLHQINELKRCANDPVYFIKTYVQVQHPVRGIVPFALFDYQIEMIKAFQGHRNNIILSSRQTGKTQTSCAYLLWFAAFNFDKTVLIASNKNENAMEIIDNVRFMYEHLPHWIKPGIKDDSYNKHEMGFDNGSFIVSTATSSTAGRGMQISCLYLDELAFVQPLIQEEFWTSITPTLATGGACIITSTPNGDTNLFARLWREANSGLNSFNPIRVDWWQFPGRDEKFKQTMQAQLGELKFRQEFLCEFLSSDTLLIDTNVLNELTNKLKDVRPKFKIKDVTFWDEIKSGYTYLVGVDPTSGAGGDFCVFEVFEFPTLKQVAEYRTNTMSVGNSYQALKQLLKYLADKDTEVFFSIENNGVGQGMITLFEQDEHRPNAEFVSENDKNKLGMTTVTKTKLKACIMLKELLEKQRMTIQSQMLLHELKTFIKHRSSYHAQYGSTDDCIAACLIVIRLVEEIAMYDDNAHNRLYVEPARIEVWTQQDVTEYGTEEQEEDEDPLPSLF